MISMTKNCPYCGQGHIVQIPDNATDEQLNAAALAVCTCDEALKHKEMASVRKRVKELFGDDSLKKFDDAFGVEVHNDLCDWAEKVYDGMYDKVVIQMENGDKATIVRVGNRIKLSREQKVKSEK